MTDKELMQQALDDYETKVQKIGGCSDGNCVVVKPKGMHTNGGCKCWKNEIRMKQLANAANCLVNTLRARLAQPEQEPFEYWNAVEGWVTVTPNEVLDGRAKQRMLQAAMRTVQEQYRDDPEVMFARGWDAGFNARTCVPNRKEQEPVARVKDLDEVKRKHLVYEKGMDWQDPLYATPPQRKPLTEQKPVAWVELTDDEQLELARDSMGKTRHWLVAQVEARLKQKNILTNNEF